MAKVKRAARKSAPKKAAKGRDPAQKTAAAPRTPKSTRKTHASPALPAERGAVPLPAPSAPSPRCFGSHLSIAGGLHNAVDGARRLGLQTVQVFVKNQRQWVAPPLKPEDIETWQARCASAPFGPTVAHATYLINLASGDEALRIRSRDAFADELLRCSSLGIPYLVVHPGAAGEQPVETAIANVSRSLDEIFDAHPGITAMPLLETTAGQGTTLGRAVEELGSMIHGTRCAARIGVCVDTCHVFAAGYDIRDRSQYEDLMGAADRAFGLQRIRCLHLNDSRGECGSHLDRHEHIGLGRIGDEGFAHVVNDPRLAAIPMILETPKDERDDGVDWDTVNVNRLRGLIT